MEFGNVRNISLSPDHGVFKVIFLLDNQHKTIEFFDQVELLFHDFFGIAETILHQHVLRINGL